VLLDSLFSGNPWNASLVPFRRSAADNPPVLPVVRLH
jgi:hypothetical protein